MKGKPKIAIVVPDVTAGHGVPRVACFLYRAIEDSGRYTPYLNSLATSSQDRYSVRLLAPRTWIKGYQIGQANWNGIRYQHVGAVFSELEFMRYMPRKKLTELLHDADIIQVVAGAPAWAYPALFANKPVALQVATMVSVERKSLLAREGGLKRLWMTLMSRINHCLERLVLKKVDVVFVENKWMYDFLSTLIPKDRLYFAPPGVDTDFFTPGTYNERGYILSVGRFSDPRKNVRLLLDAYKHLCTTLSSVSDLVLVGKAPSLRDMAYLRSLGIEDRVHIFTDVSDNVLAQYYRDARLFVLSSDEEGLGLVILEAMASGLPVVSTDCGGPSTSVLHKVTGFLTPVGDPVALADAMKCLLLDPTLSKRMGEAGRQRAVELFSVPVASRRFLEVYDKLLYSRF